MFSVFRSGMDPETDLAEFIVFALWEHSRLTMSQLYGLIPRVEKQKIIYVLNDLREHGLVARDGDGMALTDDGRAVREEKHVPPWYPDHDEDHMWHLQGWNLDGLKLDENMSPFEVKIIRHFQHPFRTSEASELIQFSSFAILKTLESGGYLRRSSESG